jgi:hypothetical protein
LRKVKKRIRGEDKERRREGEKESFCNFSFYPSLLFYVFILLI